MVRGRTCEMKGPSVSLVGDIWQSQRSRFHLPWSPVLPKLQVVPTVLSVRPVAGALLKALAPSVMVYGCAH